MAPHPAQERDEGSGDVDQDGRVHARLLDLVPGRTGKAYATWLTDRTAAFRCGVKVATLDPFRGYANALRDELSEAVPVLDAFYADLLVMPTWPAFTLLTSVRGVVRSA